MTLQMTVSPDFPPAYIAGWYIFNTWLQRQSGLPIHLTLYDSFAAQRAVLAQGGIDLIYANPYDAAFLVRECGFVTLAAPCNRADEVVLAGTQTGPVNTIEDLAAGTVIARTDDPDVNLMGMMLLEPAALHAGNTTAITVDSYPLVAKQLLQGHAGIGFFLEEAFDSLSALVRGQLRELVRSRISVIRHVLLAGPGVRAQQVEHLTTLLLAMDQDDRGQAVLESMNLSGWEAHSQEDTEFMIDLMDTLDTQVLPG
ncbi:MAG: PhnD/SsuA/transferrin family substrate-binding protein [Thiothrix sp.]|nr:PhnD/SsuA/transferrin family substrate-binding protein [Thiothrix sp.]HPQ95679.1 PhnD/SsuA/transferrin family substrate-binding protein [Thiolinea sp.]